MRKRCRQATCSFLPGCFPRKVAARSSSDASARKLDVEAGRKAAHLAALNALAVARQHLGSLDKVTRVVRLGVSGPLGEMSAITRKSLTVLQTYCKTSLERQDPCRLVYGVASLPLGTPVELEVIFEVA